MKLKDLLRWTDGVFESIGACWQAAWRLERGAALDARERAIRDAVHVAMAADPEAAMYLPLLLEAAELDRQERECAEQAGGLLAEALGFLRGLNGELEGERLVIVGREQAASTPIETA